TGSIPVGRTIFSSKNGVFGFSKNAVFAFWAKLGHNMFMPERKKQPFKVTVKQEEGRGWRINCTINGKSYRPRFKTRASAVQ
ncbi:MAG TPA: hypothetical protein DD687_11575, partial [Verrucomicrobiales bacterium]|nr:hypothetical protein [Verrucomicrobiales bacterium]